METGEVIRIKSGTAPDRWSDDNLVLATLEFTNSTISLYLGESDKCIETVMWSHTVYELLVLSEAFRYVGAGRLPDFLSVDAKSPVFGPRLSLRPSILVEFGKHSIAERERTTSISVGSLTHKLIGRRIIKVQAANMFGVVSVNMEVSTALLISEELMARAEALSAYFA